MRYETTIYREGNNAGTPVPAEVVEGLGAGRRPAVTISVNGFQYRSTVASMGGQFLVPFAAALREAAGFSEGDVTVDIELDTESRAVEPPADLAEALDAAGLREAYEQLSPSRQKAYVVNVEGAKAEATRARRVEKVVGELGG
ncbi:MAG: DUF1905 domain-containing protein [Salinibacterium sp.]|nr:YdeI/OmpD-associated family protein [Salinibacterium sp.]MBF0671788.1 DUF1905 domain-containing protein [Salinibacterium sp.]